uniref:Uncharacterized protein n=1 Tax=Anguilla anguilla TaxID=7936 RepID=A0A0E9RRJ7_ANGAN
MSSSEKKNITKNVKVILDTVCPDIYSTPSKKLLFIILLFIVLT